jgi:hypothetical protein
MESSSAQEYTSRASGDNRGGTTISENRGKATAHSGPAGRGGKKVKIWWKS